MVVGTQVDRKQTQERRWETEHQGERKQSILQWDCY